MSPLIHKVIVKCMTPLLLTIFLMACAITEICAAEEMHSDHRICGDGKYLVFSTDEQEMTLLDPKGNEYCRFHLNYGFGNGMWVEENAVLTGYSDDFIRVYSVGERKEIAAFSAKDTFVSAGPGFFYTIESETGRIRFFDDRGNLRCETECDLSGTEDYYLYDQLRELRDGWLLYFEKGDKSGAVILDRDLMFSEYVTNAFFLNALSEYRLQTFGDYFAVTPDFDGYVLYNRDGTLVLDLPVVLIHDNTDSAGLLSHIYMARSRFALKPSDAGGVVIDESLQETDLKVESTGIRSYEFIDEKRNGCCVPQDQTLCEMYDCFYVTKDEKENVYYLRKYDDENFRIKSDDMPCICDSGAAVSVICGEERGYRQTYRTLDNEGNEAGCLESVFLYGPAGDCLIASRGIYMGVMDLTGKWIWKYTWEEM